MGDHTESIQIDFDPAVISYEDLLRLFWETHNPCAKSWSRQYMSAVFYQNEEQKRVVLKTRDEAEARKGSKIHTEILKLEEFTSAEDYHQKYYLRNSDGLYEDVRGLYATDEEFIRSTVAARLNALVSGHGTKAQVAAELKNAGVPEDRARRVLAHLRE